MPTFPNFSYYNPYKNYYNNNYYNKYYNNYNKLSPNKTEENKISYEEKNKTQSCQTDKNNLATDSELNPLFEIFGLKLYMDDILILCLLYFLYEENVKDELLFIALLMLLLS